MTKIPSASGSVFRILCRVVGGHDRAALQECITARLLPELFRMAHSQDVLPALAVRCSEQDIDTAVFGSERAGQLQLELMDNTPRNMEISAQRTFKDLGRSDTQIGVMSGLALRRPQGTAAGLIR